MPEGAPSRMLSDGLRTHALRKTSRVQFPVLAELPKIQRGDPLHFVGNVDIFSSTVFPLVDEGALLTIQGALLKSPGCTFC